MVLSTPGQLAQAVYGDLRGHAFVFSGRRSGERDGLADRLQRSYAYPGELDAMEDYLLAESEAGRDAYLSVHLYNRPARGGRGRTKENSHALVWALWVDGDGAQVSDAFPAPGIVVQSSPGREQFWWPLSRPIPGARAEEFNRRIAYPMGADPGKWCLTTYLRPTGTFNHKRAKPHLVTGLVLSDERYDPDELDRLLPPLVSAEATQGARKDRPARPKASRVYRVEERRTTPGGPPVPLPADALDLWTGRRTIPNVEGGVDRSRTLYAIGRALHGAGADRELLIATLAEWDGTIWSPKYAERPKEYGRIADKLKKGGPCRLEKEAPGLACDALVEYAFSLPWVGQTGPTDFAVLVALALEVREHGRVVGDEVWVGIPTREHALLAGIAKHQTILASIARLGEEHQLPRRLNRGSCWEAQEYAVPLCTPEDHSGNTGGSGGCVPSGPRVSALLCRFRGHGVSNSANLERPLSKLHALVIAKVAARRSATLAELSLALDRRASSLARRQLAELVKVGLLVQVGDETYATPSNLVTLLERELEDTGVVGIERRQRRRYDDARKAREMAYAEWRFGPPPPSEAEAQEAALAYLRAQGEGERGAARDE